MTVHHRTEVIKTVGQGQCLWIGIIFTHFLHASVDISAMWIYLTDSLTFEHCLKTKDSVCSRMLRSDKVSIFIEIPLIRVIRFRIRLERILIVLGTHIVILTKWISLEVTSKIEAAHIGMSEETYSQEVVNLTLQEISTFPNFRYCRYISVVTIATGDHLNTDTFVRFRVFENVNTSQSFFSKIFTYYCHKEVEMFFGLQFCHF